MGKSPCRILVVDDETDIRMVMCEMLRAIGYRSSEASNGVDAIKVFTQDMPDLVLTDLRMPEMDGIELISRIHGINPDIPIIVLSGAGTLSDAIEAVRAGAWDYIVKPAGNVEAIKLVIDRALERSRLIADNRRTQERLNTALEATNTGLWDWDPVSGETYFSPSYYHMVGREPGEFPMTNESWKALIHPDDKDASEKAIIEGASKGETIEIEFRIKAKDGSWRWILARIAPLGIKDQGRIVRLIGTHTDITRRKIAEMSLKCSYDELEHKVAELTAQLNELKGKI